MATLSSLSFSDLRLHTNKRPLQGVPPTAPIHAILNTLSQQNLLHIPLLSHDSQKIVAVISLLDILSFVVSQASMTEALNKPIEQTMSLDADDENYLVWERDVHDSVAETLAAFSSGLHRALVSDSTQKLRPFLLGQSDVLRAVVDAQVPFVLPLNLEETTLADVVRTKKERPLVTVDSSASALDGFRHMQTAKTTSVAVVSQLPASVSAHKFHSGCLAAVLSAKDLRCLTADSLSILHKPVLEFLAIVTDLTKGTPTAVPPETTLMDGIRILVAAKRHHLWLIDSNRIPIGVVSQSDIIGALTNGL